MPRLAPIRGQVPGRPGTSVAIRTRMTRTGRVLVVDARTALAELELPGMGGAR